MPPADAPGSCAGPTLTTKPVTADIPSLNGIRALAVSLVFFSHGGNGQFVPGGLGVTIFFVLSGFLITTLMRREYAASAAIDLRAFYLRRVLRLMPPLLVVVVLAGLLASRSLIEGDFSTAGLLSVLFYFGNYYVIATDFAGIPAGLGVIWSLAVEEHYYVLYPPLALLLLRSRTPWLPVAVLSTLCAVILVWRCVLFAHGASEAHLSMSTDTRADAILIGCILAYVRNPALGRLQPAPMRRDLAIGAACLLLLIVTLIWRDDAFRQTARYSLQCLAIAPLIHLAVVHARSLRWLNSAPVVYLGTVSYTVYLSHQMVLYGVMHHWPQLGGMATLAVTAILTLALAETMRRWVEEPCARLRRRLHRRVPAPLSQRGAFGAPVR